MKETKGKNIFIDSTSPFERKMDNQYKPPPETIACARCWKPVSACECFNLDADPINPSYYRDGKIEVADFIADKNLNFFCGNVVKYVCRAGKKDPSTHIQDLEKAQWYLEGEIRRLKQQ